MTNNNLNPCHQLSPTTDDFLGKLEKLSHTRLDDQRTAMPWMVAEGVAAIGWKIPNRPPKSTLDQHDPPTEQSTVDHGPEQQSDLGRYNNPMKQTSQSGLSNLLLAYHNSIEERPVQSNQLTQKSSHDGLFYKKNKSNHSDRRNSKLTLSPPGQSNQTISQGSQSTDQIFDEQSALITQPSHSKISHHLKSRLYSSSMPSFHAKKVQNGQVRVSEDRRN